MVTRSSPYFGRCSHQRGGAQPNGRFRILLEVAAQYPAPAVIGWSAVEFHSRLRQGSPTDRSGQPCRPVVTCLSECPGSGINQLTPIRAPRLLTGLELSRRM
jgi:hypothetical protein